MRLGRQHGRFSGGRKDSGAVVALLAPAIAVILGGGAAVAAAVQITNLVPSNEAKVQPADVGTEIDYGSR